MNAKMKRYGNLWEKIIDLENLRFAHHEARRGKSFYKEVKMVNANEDEMIKKIQQSLINKTFTTSKYEIEDRFDGRKIRTIHKLPYYPDRIVQHALIQVVGPIWRKSFIRDTFQSIPGRGTNDARKRLSKVVKSLDWPKYYFKFDIKKYYPSVNNNLLKKCVRLKIKCPDTLWLLDNIIDSIEGLPIGNYTSQDLGNLFLNSFDWWAKQELRAKYYFRYCDDIVVLHNDKKELHNIKNKMFDRLFSMGLVVKPNWHISEIEKQGIDFVGYVFRNSHIRLRRTIADKFKKKGLTIEKQWKKLSETKICNGIMSYWGWIKPVNAKNLWRSVVNTKILNILDTMFCKNNPARKTT
jgi:RNA-directed DNA polymerase